MRTHIHNLLLLGTSLLAGQHSLAQATIEPADLLPPGARYRVAIDDAPGVVPGNSGINLAWNFPGLDADDLRLVEVMDPAESPFGEAFPGDIALVENTNTAAEHFTVTTTELLSHGRVFVEEGIQAVAPLTPPMVLLELPAAYYQYHQGVSRSVSTSYLGQDIGLGYVVDSIRLRTSIAYQSEVNGWGDLTTPLGTFDAIKQQLFSNIKDTMDVYRADQQQWIEAIQTDAYSTITWTWWSSQYGIPVLQLFDDEHDGVVDRAEWLQEELGTTSIADPVTDAELQAYPNPATDQVMVTLTGQGAATYTLCDAQGRLVQQGQLVQERSIIPLAEVEPGAHVLRVEQAGSVRRMTLVVR